jgi:hypothetical protein
MYVPWELRVSARAAMTVLTSLSPRPEVQHDARAVRTVGQRCRGGKGVGLEGGMMPQGARCGTPRARRRPDGVVLCSLHVPGVLWPNTWVVEAS